MKVNEKLVKRLAAGGVGITIFFTGFGLGKYSYKIESLFKNNDKSESKTIDDYLAEYVEKRDSLEREIADLTKQKQSIINSKTFNLYELTVIENENVKGEKNLYILYSSDTSPIYYEYHDDFVAYYNLHEYTTEHVQPFCSKYVHFYEGRPLIDYLSDEQVSTISKNGGTITTEQLDEILSSIREEYKNNENQNIKK